MIPIRLDGMIDMIIHQAVMILCRAAMSHHLVGLNPLQCVMNIHLVVMNIHLVAMIIHLTVMNILVDMNLQVGKIIHQVVMNNQVGMNIHLVGMNIHQDNMNLDTMNPAQVIMNHHQAGMISPLVDMNPQGGMNHPRGMNPRCVLVSSHNQGSAGENLRVAGLSIEVQCLPVDLQGHQNLVMLPQGHKYTKNLHPMMLQCQGHKSGRILRQVMLYLGHKYGRILRQGGVV